jgi:hypothetical protein
MNPTDGEAPVVERSLEDQEDADHGERDEPPHPPARRLALLVLAEHLLVVALGERDVRQLGPASRHDRAQVDALGVGRTSILRFICQRSTAFGVDTSSTEARSLSRTWPCRGVSIIRF